MLDLVRLGQVRLRLGWVRLGNDRFGKVRIG